MPIKIKEVEIMKKTKNEEGRQLITSSSTCKADSIPVDSVRNNIRAMLANIYDIQKLRIQSGNRLVASFLNLNTNSHMREKIMYDYKQGKIQLDEDGKIPDVYFEGIDEPKASHKKKGTDTEVDNDNVLSKAVADFTLLTSSIFEGRNISRSSPTDAQVEKALKAVDQSTLNFHWNLSDYRMAETYLTIYNAEDIAVKAISKIVVQHPMWDAFFKDIKGCGPLMAAVCIGYFDIHRARYPSSFWKYAGLDVVVNTDGVAEGRAKRHIEEVEYIDKDHRIKTKRGITYNNYLRSKLIGVLGPCILKLSRTKLEDGTSLPTGYAKAYYDYRHRIENRPVNEDKPLTPRHIHNMAIRYMVKQFIRDFWIVWRKYEGYDIGQPYYEVAKLGMKPHHYNAAFESAV